MEDARDQDLGNRLGVALDQLADDIKTGKVPATDTFGDFTFPVIEALADLDLDLDIDGLGAEMVEEDSRTPEHYGVALDQVWRAMAYLARLSDHMSAVREAKLAAQVVRGEVLDG